ncbi:hypothetical protein FVER53590_25511 [Fusarium verticillioides]|nr:hypothetical protein FVER53590_25511 [Fusarium verticillioides]
MANSVKVVVDEKRLIDQYINEHGTELDSLAALEITTWELKGAYAMSALNESIDPEGGKAFADGRYVYKTETSPVTSACHISSRNTQAGNPWQLHICRLLPSEVRRLGEATGNDVFIRYDDDLTLYSGDKLNIPFNFASGLGPTPVIVIRGQKRGTI